VNLILAIPIEVRLVVLFLMGICLGSAANWGVYRLGWHPRALGPWSPRPVGAPPRRWFDCVPVVGWLGLRREAPWHGVGFWFRPLVVELLAGIGFAWLYWWEIGTGGLLPVDFPRPLGPPILAILHQQYLAHVVLISLMLVASLIDLDEKTIPDAVTVPGALLGLLLAAALPASLLPDVTPVPGGLIILDTLHVASPEGWPSVLADACPGAQLAIGLACFWLWCAALLPRSWYSRHGWRRAVQLLWARLVRDRATYALLGLGLAGTAVIAAVWYWGGLKADWGRFSLWGRVVLPCQPSWLSLLSALVGMVAGGAIIWIVRIIGGVTLRREAMGFGDVTLMAMIGAFLGWQTCLIVFFLAPVAGLVFGVAQLILVRNPEIPYGPFLCLGALVAIVAWEPIWNWAMPLFQLGWLVPVFMLGCMVLMAVLLGAWAAFRGLRRH
jgi:leader peptidase (prepilin peptidase) / N-methyltransferase